MYYQLAVVVEHALPMPCVQRMYGIWVRASIVCPRAWTEFRALAVPLCDQLRPVVVIEAKPRPWCGLYG